MAIYHWSNHCCKLGIPCNWHLQNNSQTTALLACDTGIYCSWTEANVWFYDAGNVIYVYCITHPVHLMLPLCTAPHYYCCPLVFSCLSVNTLVWLHILVPSYVYKLVFTLPSHLLVTWYRMAAMPCTWLHKAGTLRSSSTCCLTSEQGSMTRMTLPLPCSTGQPRQAKIR